VTSEATAWRYCGRSFSRAELDQIRELIAANPAALRAELSRLVCAKLGWSREDGRLKDMSCRVAMLRMQADGLLQLPLRATAITTENPGAVAPLRPNPRGP